MQPLIAQHTEDRTITSEKGFTLIELITVIVLLGIVGVMSSEVITSSLKGFAQTDDAMELFEEGKLAMMRMEREIHHMLPNSIDNPTNATDIHFGLVDVNTLTSAAPAITGQYEPIGNSLKIRDLSLNPLPMIAPPILLSIYNTSWTDFSSTSTTVRKIYGITAINSPPGSMTLDKAVIGGHSANKRYYPVYKAVRYFITGTTLFRAETPITLAPDDFITTLDAEAASALLTNVTSLRFNYSPASLTSNALVRIDFTLSRNGTTLDFHKEIQVRNVP